MDFTQSPSGVSSNRKIFTYNLIFYSHHHLHHPRICCAFFVFVRLRSVINHLRTWDLGLGTEQSRRPAKSHSANPHPRLSNLVDNHQERCTGGEASWKMWIGKAFGENLVAGAEAVYLSVPHKIFRNFYRHLSPLFLWKPIPGFSFVETNLGLN